MVIPWKRLSCSFFRNLPLVIIPPPADGETTEVVSEAAD